jgi:hypothetical protein
MNGERSDAQAAAEFVSLIKGMAPNKTDLSDPTGSNTDSGGSVLAHNEPMTDAVTRPELDAHLQAIRSDMRAEGAELRRDFASLRADIAQMAGSVSTSLGEMRGQLGELRGEIGEVRGSVDGLKSSIGMLQWVIGTVAAVAGIWVAYLQLKQAEVPVAAPASVTAPAPVTQNFNFTPNTQAPATPTVKPK